MTNDVVTVIEEYLDYAIMSPDRTETRLQELSVVLFDMQKRIVFIKESIAYEEIKRILEPLNYKNFSSTTACDNASLALTNPDGKEKLGYIEIHYKSDFACHPLTWRSNEHPLGFLAALKKHFPELCKS